MHLYLLRKSFLFFVTLLLLTLISFSMVRIDPSSLFHDTFFLTGWVDYLEQLLAGNFGTANDGKSVISHLSKVFPATIELCFFAFLVAMILGIPLGIIAGITRGYFLDRIIYSTTLLGSSIPIFGVAILFIMLFSVYFGDFPTANRYNLLLEMPKVTGFSLIDVFLADISDRRTAIYNILYHLTMPGLVLAIAPTAEIIKLLRDSVAEVMTQNYIKAAATRGLSKFAIVRLHVIKNALPPILPKFGLQLSTMMSLAIITESIFNWPGIGSWLLKSLELQDYISVQAAVLVMGITVLSLSLLFELLSAMISPLIRKEWYAVKS